MDYVKKQRSNVVSSAMRVARLNFWLWLIPLITFLVCVGLWLLLALSNSVRAEFSNVILRFPSQPAHLLPGLSFGLLILSAALYFYFDYILHAHPFKSEGVAYEPLHHARMVVLPRLRYNWRQSLYWLSYGLISFFVIATLAAGQVKPVHAYASNEFVTTWKTDNPGVTTSNQIRIPTVGTGYNYTVDWGDGNITSNQTSDATHTYSTSGTYTVKITGVFPRIFFNNNGDKEKILSVEQWGSNQWSSMNAAFRRVPNLVVNAVDAPDLSSVTDTSYMFCGATSFNQNINTWDVSNVTNMSSMFAGCNATTIFNQPLNTWDVSNVTNMSAMFFGNNSFNQNINSWNTASVTDMSNMFVGGPFNQPLNTWDVSNVTNMIQMFSSNSSFNQPLNNWDVSNVTNMSAMFAYASAFNSSLANWNVSNVTDMSAMFRGAYNFNQPLNSWTTSNKLKNTSQMFYNVGFGYGPGAFNQPLTNWNVSGATDMSGMFTYQRNFNGDLSTWNTASVTNMSSMFQGATAFNQNISSWSVGSVTNMSSMFQGATAFNQPLNNWDVSKVTTMFMMFSQATAFNQPLNNWDVSKVTDMLAMFSQATVFNSDLSTWNTASVTNMSSMFQGATAFNQNISSWSVGSVTNMSSMFQGATAFNQPLNNWDVIKVTDTRSMFQNASTFNRSLNNWNVSNVTTMRSMFQGAAAFNSAVGAWNVSKVTDMYFMFELATAFNQPINSWNVGSVTNMTGMLADNPSFNQPLNSWDVANVTDLSWMFSNSTTFNQPLNNWDISKVVQLSGIFNGATAFNQPLNNWNTSKVYYTSSAFLNATAFNQSLANWNIEQVYQMHNMLTDSGISYTNYDATLNGWAQQTPRTNVPFSAGNIKYCQAESARDHLIDNFSWGIYDGGKYCGEPPVVSTGVADGIAEDQATLHGTVSTSETDLSATGFQWGKTTSYANDTGNLGTNLGNIETEIEPDECGTTYHYRAYATNLGGTTYGPDQTFATNACLPSFTNGFITTWKTDNPGSTASNQVRLSFGNSNYEVDWGDGNTQVVSGITPTHTYAAPGVYTIRVMGDIRSFNANSTGNPAKLLSVEQWGNIEWHSMDYAFWNATNLQINAVDAPDLSRVTRLISMFYNATSFNSDISHWDTSTITDMTGMFYGATTFNKSLNGWDTGNVTNMNNMFILASSFNSDISQWNTGKVESMNTMFSNTPFNQSLNSWDVSKVRSMIGMFQSNSAFNQPLDDWNTNNLEWAGNMFYNATSFNQPLNNWNVGKVTDMGWMFGGASSFNQPLDNWDTSSVTYTAYAFAGATSFNQSLSDWEMGSVTNMVSMFAGASSFNQSLASWDMQNVRWASVALNNTALSLENYDFTLAGWAVQDLQKDVYFGASPTKYCYSANARQSIIDDYNWTITDGGENCPSVPDFTNGFITTWKTDNPGTSTNDQITIPTSGNGYNYTVDWGDGNIETDLTGDATHTYANAGTYTVKIIGNFPQIHFCGGNDAQKILTVEQWGANQWSSMHCSFTGATNLTVPAADAPDLSNVTDMDLMFWGASSFNQPINHWDISNVQSMSALFANASSFNQPLDNWDTSNVVIMSRVFDGATSFNGSIADWDTSDVTSMYYMFSGATSFNQPLDNWDTGNVREMADMFSDATSFNQPLDNWDTGSVGIGTGSGGMREMFAGASSFNQPLNNWDTSNVVTMLGMFAGASSFNQSLANWNVSTVQAMDFMFNDTLMSHVSGLDFYPSGLSTSNYDATLAGWSQQDLHTGVTFDAGTSTYCDAANQRQNIMNNFSWTIHDSGQDCPGVAKQVHTLNPEKLSSTHARLKGLASGTGAGGFVTGGFEWGETNNYGNTVNNLAISSNNFGITLTLSCNKTYFYRAFAIDGSNTKVYGQNTIFTLSCAEITQPQNKTLTVKIASPTPGQGYAVGEDVIFKADVTAGNKPVKDVRFYLNGELFTTTTKPPYETSLQNAKNGVYQLIAVAEDTNGTQVATSPTTFVVNQAGIDILTPSKVSNLKLELVDEKKYPITGPLAQVLKSLPWVILLVGSGLYMFQAYNQLQQNTTLKQRLETIRRTREGVEGFLHIVTHYLATPITVISLTLEATAQSRVPNETSLLQQSVEKLKTYVNGLIAGLNAQVSGIKLELISVGKIDRKSIIKWVVIPSLLATVLALVALAGMTGLGIWPTTQGAAVFNSVMLIFSIGLITTFFQVWQNQRQLNADLVATSLVAKKELEGRMNFIAESQQTLMAKSKQVEAATTIEKQGVNQAFMKGVAQLKKVASAFSSITEITSTGATDVASAWSALPLVQKFQNLAEVKGVNITYEGPEQIRSWLPNKEMNKIVNIIIDNAVQFTSKDGSIVITLRSTGPTLSMTVTDTGIGIAKDKLATIMQPFARGTSAETYDYEGLGLNLYVARLIVEKYGGFIKIESKEGMGTEVSITV